MHNIFCVVDQLAAVGGVWGSGIQADRVWVHRSEQEEAALPSVSSRLICLLQQVKRGTAVLRSRGYVLAVSQLLWEMPFLEGAAL